MQHFSSPASGGRVASDTPSPVAHVDRVDGPTIVGWAFDAASPGDELIQVFLGERLLDTCIRRVDRADVRAALGLSTPFPGFEIDLPESIWHDMSVGTDTLQVRVDGRDIGHAKLKPEAAGLRLWIARAALEADPAQRQRRLVLARRHIEQAAEWGPPTDQHLDAPLRIHVVVEGLKGLSLYGWAWSEPSGTEVIGLLCNGQPLPCPISRTSREDVASILGMEDLNFGFEAELPGALWAQVPPDGAAVFQITVNGQAEGGQFSLARNALPACLDAAWALADASQRRRQSLLAMEHVLHAGTFAALNGRQRSLLRNLAEGAGLGPIFDAGSIDAMSKPLEVPQRAVGRLGRLLRRRWLAAIALRVLAVLKGFAVRQPRLQAAAVDLEIVLTRSTALFDRAWYERQAPADKRHGLAPLRHYVTEGDARALVPMRLFDPRHYTGQLPGRRAPTVNRLLHYALKGQFQGFNPCAWFDTGHYLRGNRDVARAGRGALQHFASKGWGQGRAPVAGFNRGLATAQSLDQRLARLGLSLAADPLIAYLLSGLPAGLPAPVQDRLPWMPVTEIDGRDFLDPVPWKTLKQRQGPAQVDVVIPVYAGAQETLCCIWSVLTSPSRTPFELVAIDDCSPEAALSDMLTQLARWGLITLLVNAENLGFVRTVNRGLAVHPDREVIILNSDTEVHGDWLDRLMRAAQVQPRAASLTPLSNNATLCSYPRAFDDNGDTLEMRPAALDALAAATNPGVHIAAPTGMGFCMYLRRACLKQIGAFDAERFGRGYGEENDWCLRASKVGWRHFICADVYVTHRGSVSFKGEVNERVQTALALLLERYPGYTRRIDSLIAADPLLPARARLDAARLRTASGRPFAMLVSHARGGGTERHEEEQAALLRARGLEVVYLRPSVAAGLVALRAPTLLEAVNLSALQLRADDLLLEVLRALPVREVHLHHLADFPDTIREVLPALCTALQASLSVTLHDYHFICPRINLVGPSRRYCGEPDAAGCAACLSADESGRAAGDIGAWRRRHTALLAHAKEIRVPDLDVSQRMARYFPEHAFTVEPHEPPQALAALPRPKSGAALSVVPVDARDASVARERHVLVIGALSVIKGYDVLLALAQSPRSRALGLRYTLLGHSMADDALTQAGVRVLGRYDDETLPQRIADLAPDLIFIPSVWPETYCYVLSAGLRSGCRLAVFDIGAQARRLREAGVDGLVVPLALASTPDALAQVLGDALAARPERADGGPAYS